MSLKSFFDNAISNFKSWFTSEKQKVVAAAKPIIEELVPVAESDLMRDGSMLMVQAATALAAGQDPLVLIPTLAVAVWKAMLEQGKDLSKAATTAAAAIIVEKAKAIQAGTALSDAA